MHSLHDPAAPLELRIRNEGPSLQLDSTRGLKARCILAEGGRLKAYTSRRGCQVALISGVRGHGTALLCLSQQWHHQTVHLSVYTVHTVLSDHLTSVRPWYHGCGHPSRLDSASTRRVPLPVVLFRSPEQGHADPANSDAPLLQLYFYVLRSTREREHIASKALISPPALPPL